MAIPLPNPNIDDTKKVDNLTWSSNKIAGEINEAKAAVEAEIPTPEDVANVADSEIESYLSYSSTEKKIGKIGDDDLYEVNIDVTLEEMVYNTIVDIADLSSLNIDRIVYFSSTLNYYVSDVLTNCDPDATTNFVRYLYTTKKIVGRQNIVADPTGADFNFIITLKYTKAS